MENAGKEENEKKDGGREDASFADPTKLALETLRMSHANYLACLWRTYGNSVYAGSVLHAVHAAMLKYEMDFLNTMQKKDSDEKSAKR